jgi:hypothetical protein
MKQMEIPEEMKIDIDYNDIFPLSVGKLRPQVFRDGDHYCCLLGPNPAEGVFGCGETVTEALLDWDDQMHKRVMNADENDEVAAFIKSKNIDK